MKCKKHITPSVKKIVTRKEEGIPLATSQSMTAVREALPCRKPAPARNLVFIFSPSNLTYLIYQIALDC
jgi:hypothetical protein